MVYIGWDNREYEDLEMDNMRQAQLLKQSFNNLEEQDDTSPAERLSTIIFPLLWEATNQALQLPLEKICSEESEKVGKQLHLLLRVLAMRGIEPLEDREEYDFSDPPPPCSDGGCCCGRMGFPQQQEAGAFQLRGLSVHVHNTPVRSQNWISGVSFQGQVGLLSTAAMFMVVSFSSLLLFGDLRVPVFVFCCCCSLFAVLCCLS